MAHLMYSNDDQLITAAELAAVPTPAPMGAFHQPVGFGEYLDLVKHRLVRAGVEIGHEEYCLDGTGQTFFGMMGITVDGFARDDMELFIGVRGSHNQKVPRALAIGTQVMVCSNLCFSGNLGTLSTKQTTNIMQRLPRLVDQAVAVIPQMAQRENQRVDAYRSFDMKPRWGDAALVEIHRRGGLSGAQLGRAIHQWDEPAHDEHAEDGRSAWRLLNACTEAVKPQGAASNMHTVQQRTGIVSSFLDDVVGL